MPRVFARRGPFENPDRVGHISSIGVLSFLPSQTLACLRGVHRPPHPPGDHRTTHHSVGDDPSRPGGEGHLRQGADRIGQDTCVRHPARGQLSPIAAAPPAERWSSSRHGSWPRRCTTSSETCSATTASGSSPSSAVPAIATRCGPCTRASTSSWPARDASRT